MISDAVDFSIIVPTFNRGLLVIKTLQSLLQQDYRNFEILVIDDGSTDDTEEIIRTINDTHLIYHRISNRERGAARNYGVSKARGRYINFFDSDDLAYPFHLESATAAIAEANAPEVFSLSYQIIDENEMIMKDILLRRNVSEFICDGNHLSCNGVFLKREVALGNPFSEDRALSGSEDYELWLRLAARFSFPCFPYISHAVVQHSGRSTLNFNPQPLIIRKSKMMEYAFNDIEVQKVFGQKKKYLQAGTESYIALHLALGKGNKKDAWRWWRKSIQTVPSTIINRRSFAILKHIILG